VEKKLQTANLTAGVYQKIRKGILNGTWSPGQSLTELMLSQLLQVSRTPVREALHQLELEGLIELRPNRGAVVIGINTSDIEDIYEIRTLLEERVAQRAALRADKQDIETLREIVDLTEFYVERSSYDKITEMDDRFHQYLYSLSGSRMFQKTLADLHTYVEPVRERSIREPDRATAMLAEHRAIVEAIAAHNAQEAGRLMTLHITCAGEHMEKKHLL
jgi:DNA-binding GntR family transcriptional regulator